MLRVLHDDIVGPLATVILFMSLLVFAQPAQGQNVGVNQPIAVSLPVAKEKARGFTVNITSRTDGATGYLPLEITLTSTSTFSADRNFNIRIEPAELGYSPPQNGIVCNIPLTAAQGTIQTRVLRHLPKWSLGTGYKVRVFEDGVEIEDYQGEIGQLMQRQSRPQTELLTSEVTLTWLHIVPARGQGAAMRTALSGLMAQTQQTNRNAPRISGSVRSIRRNALAGPLMSVVAMSDLSTDWRSYQSSDGVLISAEDLPLLATEHAAQFQGLRDWVMSGGTLVMLDAASAKNTLQQLSFQWNAKYSESELIQYLGETIQGTYGRRQSLFDQITKLEAAIKASSVTPQMLRGLTPTAIPGDPKLELQRLKRALAALNRAVGNQQQWDQRLWAQPVAAGRVIGITSTQGRTATDWEILLKLFGYRKSAALRRGVEPMIGDARVRRWLIPGVAQPPIYTFIGLLTVFVILVGPIAYRRTTRYGRGYLMFAIAPFLALTTTIAMFTYGVVADGFGTMARVRQVTFVDGASGDAFERVRSTYFAGVRPGDGLKFPGDAEVMAYPDHNGRSWDEMNRDEFLSMGSVRIGENVQRFDSSFLPSRAQRQFVVHAPRHQLGRLSIKGTKNAPELSPPTVDSTFDFPLRDVVIRDDAGIYWKADLIRPQETGVVCNRILPAKVSGLLGDLYNDHRPLAEVRQKSNYSSYDRRIRDLTLVINRNLGETNEVTTDGTFEALLQQYLQIDGELPERTFIAQSDISADVIAVAGAELVRSIRYVFGTMP